MSRIYLTISEICKNLTKCSFHQIKSWTTFSLEIIMQWNIDSSNVNIASLTSSIDPKSSERESTSRFLACGAILPPPNFKYLLNFHQQKNLVIFSNKNLSYIRVQKNCDALQILVMKVQHESKDIVGPFILKITHEKRNGLKTFVVFTTMCIYKISNLNQSLHIAKVVGLVCNNYISLAIYCSWWWQCAMHLRGTNIFAIGAKLKLKFSWQHK
jgi:hypothetical protein